MDKKYGKSSWKVYFEGNFWGHRSREHAGFRGKDSWLHGEVESEAGE